MDCYSIQNRFFVDVFKNRLFNKRLGKHAPSFVNFTEPPLVTSREIHQFDFFAYLECQIARLFSRKVVQRPNNSSLDRRAAVFGGGKDQNRRRICIVAINGCDKRPWHRAFLSVMFTPPPLFIFNCLHHCNNLTFLNGKIIWVFPSPCNYCFAIHHRHRYHIGNSYCIAGKQTHFPPGSSVPPLFQHGSTQQNHLVSIFE
mmetsp:Transcript_10570/g.20019  ORF Transcript_10570/g.20019 Transcript_10570/m.20019 type:complete len:200 (-) Transcript_10570:290-889(-)